MYSRSRVANFAFEDFEILLAFALGFFTDFEILGVFQRTGLCLYRKKNNKICLFSVRKAWPTKCTLWVTYWYSSQISTSLTRFYNHERYELLTAREDLNLTQFYSKVTLVKSQTSHRTPNELNFSVPSASQIPGHLHQHQLLILNLSNCSMKAMSETHYY